MRYFSLSNLRYEKMSSEKYYLIKYIESKFFSKVVSKVEWP